VVFDLDQKPNGQLTGDVYAFFPPYASDPTLSGEILLGDSRVSGSVFSVTVNWQGVAPSMYSALFEPIGSPSAGLVGRVVDLSNPATSATWGSDRIFFTHE